MAHAALQREPEKGTSLLFKRNLILIKCNIFIQVFVDNSTAQPGFHAVALHLQSLHPTPFSPAIPSRLSHRD